MGSSRREQVVIESLVEAHVPPHNVVELVEEDQCLRQLAVKGGGPGVVELPRRTRIRFPGHVLSGVKYETFRAHRLDRKTLEMSWDRLSGPYGCGTLESVRAMYNDPAVANRNEFDWRNPVAGSTEE